MTSPHEDTVRAYLTAVKDPAALRDDEAIRRTQEALTQTHDVIERLRLVEKLRKLTNPTLDGVEEQFIAHAKEWADVEGISAETFLSEGVDPDVLIKAGFTVDTARPRSKRPTKSSSRRPPVSRKRVTTEEVVAAIPKGPFTAAQLQERSGASPAVVRKAIAAEVDAGRLTTIGPDPDHAGPGRAPMRYERAPTPTPKRASRSTRTGRRRPAAAKAT